MSEDESPNLIPATWIKQYHFCPRIIYYLGVLGYSEELTESMVEGKEYHLTEERRVKRRKTVAGEKKEAARASWSRITATSKRIGLYGVIDEVYETDNGLVVVENKFMKAPRKPYPSHVYQAAAYAMLAEEALGKIVRKVSIRYVRDGKAFEIPLTEDLRKHVLWSVSRIRSIIEKEKIPRGNRKKCVSCGFMKICGGA